MGDGFFGSERSFALSGILARRPATHGRFCPFLMGWIGIGCLHFFVLLSSGPSPCAICARGDYQDRVTKILKLDLSDEASEGSVNSRTIFMYSSQYCTTVPS
jgi:hypothetical protein